MSTILNIADFCYENTSKQFTAFASDLPTTINGNAFFIKGKKEMVKFVYDYTLRDQDQDIRFWSFLGADSKGNEYRAKIFND